MKKLQYILLFILISSTVLLAGCFDCSSRISSAPRDNTRSTRTRDRATDESTDISTERTERSEGAERTERTRRTDPDSTSTAPSETEDEQEGLMRYRVTRFAHAVVSEEGHAPEPFGGSWNVDYESDLSSCYFVVEQPPFSSSYRFTMEGPPLYDGRVGAAALASNLFDSDFPAYGPYIDFTDNVITGRFVSYAQDVYPVYFREVEAYFDEDFIHGEISVYHGEIVYSTYPEFEHVVTLTHVIIFEGVRVD